MSIDSKSIYNIKIGSENIMEKNITKLIRDVRKSCCITSGIDNLLEKAYEHESESRKAVVADTSTRWLKGIKEFMSGDVNNVKATMFPTEYTDQVITVDNCEFSCLCEHHLFPFFGSVTIKYKPNRGLILGLSKFPRLVKELSTRLPSTQETLCGEICDWLKKELTDSFEVIIRGSHTCMSCRGALARNAETIVISKHGDI